MARTRTTNRFAVGMPIRIGISACLLGQRVRYDGAHKHNAYITGTLGRVFRLVPVCPETAIGLGVPRTPIRLEGDPRCPRAVGVDVSRRDVTGDLAACGERVARELSDISGFILKSRSPSCGLHDVEVHAGRTVRRHGTGIFARSLMRTRPLLPVETDDRLGDADIRANFLERVLAYRRLQALVARGLTRAGLVEFHAEHELTLLAHAPADLRALNRLLENRGRAHLGRLAWDYAQGFMRALHHPATPARHAAVMRRVLRALRPQMNAADAAELDELIAAFRHGRAPRIVPLVLLRHHLARIEAPRLENQVYLRIFAPGCC